MYYLNRQKTVYFSFLVFSMLLPIKAISETDASTPDSVSTKILSEYVENNSLDSDELCDDEDFSENNKEQDAEEDSFFSVIDAPHNFISLGIESMARNMDEYFSDDQAIYELSGSYLLLRENMIMTEGGNINYTNDVHFKLRLPNTEKKLKIFFETTNEKQPYDILTRSETTPVTNTGEDQYIAGVQGESGELLGWKYKPVVGLRLTSTIESFVRFRFNTEYKFDKWSINWHETPYWERLTGWGFDSYFELNRKISSNDLFRSSTFAGWREETDYFELSQVFSMHHSLSNQKTLSYFVGAYGKSKPIIYTTHFLTGLSYRQNIYKDYLFVEFSPQILYQEINNFKPEHSLTIRLEMYFKK